MSGYIGTQPVPQATQTRDSFTATSGQTSFATGGYTPNFLDVYLNGVKLAAADYIATNGSDVVLASGAATGDILEVVAFTTFTPADLPAGTPSIDDNGNATAITIDSNENVLVGKTSLDGTGSRGIELRSDGLILASKLNAQPMSIDRNGTDGDILWLGKNGSKVGSIGVNSGDQVYFAASDGMGIKVDTDNTSVEASNASGADNDNAVNLGSSGTRWKDLYLSGGVYLGGTGSANKLEDYESGTFTPVLEGSVSNPSYGGGQAGRYTKVGNIVHFSAYVDANPWSSNGSGDIYFAGLPFTVDGTNAGATRNISMSIWGPTIGSGYSIVGQPVDNSDYLKFALWGDNRNQVVWTYSTASFSSGNAIYIQGHYFTNS